jgi:hypothetical protein
LFTGTLVRWIIGAPEITVTLVCWITKT